MGNCTTGPLKAIFDGPLVDLDANGSLPVGGAYCSGKEHEKALQAQ